MLPIVPCFGTGLIEPRYPDQGLFYTRSLNEFYD